MTTESENVITTQSHGSQASASVGAEWVSSGDSVQFVTSHCTACSRNWFPVVDMCPHCGSTAIEPSLAGPVGVAYASTVVRAGAKGFDAPYVLSYIDVGGVRVLVHVDAEEALPPGSPVRLELRASHREGETEKVVAKPVNTATSEVRGK